jgi:hypothetical protein
MGGGLLQLVAYGAQDVYLTGNPQITFFKVVYRRHTNFAIEAIQQTPTGSNSLGSRASFQITRNGDLIHRIYFNGKIKNNNTDADKAVALVPNFGQKLLKNVELEIGGQRIDKHYSEWLYIWNELSLPVGKRDGYNTMVGANSYNLCTKLKEGEEYELYVPLEFWFCRNVGLALPLIALQYHEVKINIEYETQDNLVDINDYNLCYDEEAKTGGDKCTNGNKKYGTTDDYTLTVGGAAAPIFAVNSNIALLDATLWVDYIFLDTDERRRFAQLSHEYLIEQLQFTGTDTINKSSSPDNMKSIRMNFNHPCKELVWTIKRNNTSSHKVFWNNFSSAEGSEGAGNANNTMNDYSESTNTTLQAKIMLNGNDRFATRKGEYFSLVQPYQHHENTPDENHKGINVYSFALKPEEHQPSGTLNMSRIDTAVLNVSSKVEGTIYVFAVNYNVLRILSGMGGLAYSN